MIEPETIAVIPAFNEGLRIGSVVRAAMRAETIDGVVVVDDGSSDNTSEVAFQSARVEDRDNTFFAIVNHEYNVGKSESLATGVKRAKELGGSALKTLVFLDADSSPIWSRETEDNMKLWQKLIFRTFDVDQNVVASDIVEGRQEAFITLLARYIDEIAEPVTKRQQVMRVGMYERNVITDTIFTIADQHKLGGHAGNRAISVELWDELMEKCERRGISLTGWQAEAALNECARDQATDTFIMRGIVNVGSRVKAGSVWQGIRRMAVIHGQAPHTRLLFKK